MSMNKCFGVFGDGDGWSFFERDRGDGWICYRTDLDVIYISYRVLYAKGG